MNRIRIHVLPSSRGRLTPLPRLLEPLACSFTHRPCSLPRLEGQDFCLKHILEDRNAPFKQCSYVSAKTSRRCPGAAPKSEKKDGVSYCADHARKNALAARLPSQRSRSTGPSPEALLAQLSGYLKSEGNSGASDNSRSEASKILDDDSWSEGEPETVLLDQTWRGEADSEADSIDSDQEDPLKHAGVYTAEEVALVMREKLIRLQSLYIDQFRRLQHLLKEKRRHYLHTCRLERDTFGSGLLTGTEVGTSRERVDLRKLQALRRYRRRYGVEAVLQHQLKERRLLATEGTAQQAHSASVRAAQRCSANTEGSRCTAPSLPMARHCLTHILLDSGQVLFRSCAAGASEVPCARPVTVNLSADACCPLHLQVPPLMYRPEGGLCASEQLEGGGGAAPDMYLSTAELQPSEILPLEFSDDCLDVVGDDPPCPPSPLLDSAPGRVGVLSRLDSSEGSAHQLATPAASRPAETGTLHILTTGSPRGQGASLTDPQPRETREQNGTRDTSS